MTDEKLTSPILRTTRGIKKPRHGYLHGNSSTVPGTQLTLDVDKDMVNSDTSTGVQPSKSCRSASNGKYNSTAIQSASRENFLLNRFDFTMMEPSTSVFHQKNNKRQKFSCSPHSVNIRKSVYTTGLPSLNNSQVILDCSKIPKSFHCKKCTLSNLSNSTKIVTTAGAAVNERFRNNKFKNLCDTCTCIKSTESIEVYTSPDKYQLKIRNKLSPSNLKNEMNLEYVHDDSRSQNLNDDCYDALQVKCMNRFADKNNVDPVDQLNKPTTHDNKEPYDIRNTNNIPAAMNFPSIRSKNKSKNFEHSLKDPSEVKAASETSAADLNYSIFYDPDIVSMLDRSFNLSIEIEPEHNKENDGLHLEKSSSKLLCKDLKLRNASPDIFHDSEEWFDADELVTKLPLGCSQHLMSPKCVKMDVEDFHHLVLSNTINIKRNTSIISDSTLPIIDNVNKMSKANSIDDQTIESASQDQLHSTASKEPASLPIANMKNSIPPFTLRRFKSPLPCNNKIPAMLSSPSAGACDSNTTLEGAAELANTSQASSVGSDTSTLESQNLLMRLQGQKLMQITSGSISYCLMLFWGSQ